ncbi:hypothetical protein IQ64_25165 [Streptomyces stelliscabiei]|nr:hypothetical protein IQ64_25165 [Streptomyces stelliscabiei]
MNRERSGSFEPGRQVTLVRRAGAGAGRHRITDRAGRVPVAQTGCGRYPAGQGRCGPPSWADRGVRAHPDDARAAALGRRRPEGAVQRSALTAARSSPSR